MYQAGLNYRNLGLEVVLHHVFGLQEADGVLDKVVVDGAVLERNVPVLGAFAEPGGDQQRLPDVRVRREDLSPEPDRPGWKDTELNAVDVVEF